jgi:prepilin-type N-terminal cleavage/methylation domain-containing protein
MKRVFNDKGFTLVELMVASVILIVALVPIYFTLTQGYISMRMAHEYNEAAFLLQARAEEIRNSAFSHITSKDPVEESGYTIEQTVTDINDSVLVAKKVELTISKKLNNGEDRSLGELEFLVYEKALK